MQGEAGHINTEGTENTEVTEMFRPFPVCRAGLFRLGPFRFFVCEAEVNHRSASGLVKRSPNMMANWFAAGLQ